MAANLIAGIELAKFPAAVTLIFPLVVPEAAILMALTVVEFVADAKLIPPPTLLVVFKRTPGIVVLAPAL